MRFLADENVEREIVEVLRASGHDVWWMSDEAPGSIDAEVLRLAVKLDAVLITNDRDFSQLVFEKRLPHTGVLFVRLADAGAAEKANAVERAVDREDGKLVGAFAVLTPRGVRYNRR